MNYIEHLLILVSTVTGCVSIFAFASLVGIPGGVTNSAAGLKICVITAGTKKRKSIIMKKKEKYDKIGLSLKSKLSAIEVLISNVLINLSIAQGEFVSTNDLLKEYDNMQEQIKNLKT